MTALPRQGWGAPNHTVGWGQDEPPGWLQTAQGWASDLGNRAAALPSNAREALLGELPPDIATRPLNPLEVLGAAGSLTSGGHPDNSPENLARLAAAGGGDPESYRVAEGLGMTGPSGGLRAAERGLGAAMHVHRPPAVPEPWEYRYGSAVSAGNKEAEVDAYIQSHLGDLMQGQPGGGKTRLALRQMATRRMFNKPGAGLETRGGWKDGPMYGGEKDYSADHWQEPPWTHVPTNSAMREVEANAVYLDTEPGTAIRRFDQLEEQRLPTVIVEVEVDPSKLLDLRTGANRKILDEVHKASLDELNAAVKLREAARNEAEKGGHNWIDQEEAIKRAYPLPDYGELNRTKLLDRGYVGTYNGGIVNRYGSMEKGELALLDTPHQFIKKVLARGPRDEMLNKFERMLGGEGKKFLPGIGLGYAVMDDPEAEEQPAVGGGQALPGWEPTVGSGADGDEFQGWDPIRRLGEVGGRFVPTSGRFNPLLGAIEGVNLPFDVATQALRYGGGVVRAGEQAGAEQLNLPGFRPGGRQDYGWFGERNVAPLRNPFDPTEAVRRYEAGVHPLVQFGGELALNARLGGLAAKGGLTAARAIGKAAQVTPEAGALSLVAPGWVERTQKAGEILTSPAVKYGLPAVTGVTAGLSAAAEQEGTPEKIMAGAAAGLGGLALGSAASWAGGRVGKGFLESAAHVKLGGIHNLPDLDPEKYTSSLSKSLIREHQAKLAEEGGQVPFGRALETKFYTTEYPGGMGRMVWDKVRGHLTDQLAPIETAERLIDIEKRQLTGQGLSDDESALQAMRRVYGQAGGAGGWIIDRNVMPKLQTTFIKNQDDVEWFERLAIRRMAYDRSLGKRPPAEGPAPVVRTEVAPPIAREVPPPQPRIGAAAEGGVWPAEKPPLPLAPEEPRYQAYGAKTHGHGFEPVGRVVDDPLEAHYAAQDYAERTGQQAHIRSSEDRFSSPVTPEGFEGPTPEDVTHAQGTLDKIHGLSRPNSVRAESTLNDLEDRGFDVSDALSALDDYREAPRDERADAWETFLDSLHDIELTPGEPTFPGPGRTGWEPTPPSLADADRPGPVISPSAPRLAAPEPRVQPSVIHEPALGGRQLPLDIPFPVEEGGMRTGPFLQNETANLRELEDIRMLIDERYTKGAAAHAEEVMEDISSTIGNLIGDAGYKAGVFDAKLRDALKDGHSVWGVLYDAGDQVKANAAHPERGVGAEFSTWTQGVDRWHSGDYDTLFSLKKTLAYMPHMLQLFERNHAMQKLVANRQYSSWWTRTMIPHVEIPERTPSGLPVYDEDGAIKTFLPAIPPNMDVVPVFQDGALNKYLLPREFSDPLKGLSSAQMDVLTGFQAKLNQPFRLGITAFSMPFILGNVTRDIQSGIQNSEFGGWTFFRNYMGAWADQLTDGFDQFAARHPNSPHLQALSGKIASSLDNILETGALGGPKGRALEPYYMSGAGFGTYSETSLARGTAFGRALPAGSLPERVGGKLGGALHYVGKAVTGPQDFLSTISQFAEVTPRLAIYRASLGAGKSTERAAYLARSSTVDFSKAGDLVRLANVWAPLLNARVQGTLTSAGAAMRDPEGYAMKLAAWATIPSIGLYMYNRMKYNDLYDLVPQEDRDRNFIFMLGSYTDEWAKPKPIYLKFAKNEVSAMATTPVEHMMDTLFHTRYLDEPLEKGQRTERSDGQMWMSTLSKLAPINVNGEEIYDPLAWGMAAVTMSPIFGTIAQMWANKDQFRNREIIPDNQMPLPFQYRNDKNTPKAVSAFSELLAKAGVHDLDIAAPAMLTFGARGLGGTYAETYLGAGDVVFSALEKAGLFNPEEAFKPNTLSDLNIPAGADPEQFQQFLEELPREDLRPAWARLIPRILGTAGGQQAIQAKLRAVDPTTRRQIEQSRDFHDAYFKGVDVLDRKTEEVFESAAKGELTYAKTIDSYSKLRAARRELYDALKPNYPLAVFDDRARDELHAKLPGVPVGTEFKAALADPATKAGVPLADFADQLAARYQNPPGLDPTLSPRLQRQARQDELSRMSNEFKVPASVIKDAITAHVLERDVPITGIPNLALERMLNDYVLPPEQTVGDTTYPAVDNLGAVSADELRARRNLVVHQYATELGQPEQLLLERLQSRMTSPDENSAMQKSMNNAFELSNRLADPKAFPRFTDRTGETLGMPLDWPVWEEEINKYKSVPRWRWPRDIVEKDAAWRSSELRRLNYMFQDKNYQDYLQWFGIGRNHTPLQWGEFQSGAFPKYKRGSPEQWQQWDSFLQVYNTMPPGTLKSRMAMKASQIRVSATPAWGAQLDLDAAERRRGELGPLYAAARGEV